MHLKRYQKQTVQEALRAVREELGPQALVLSTRMVAAPGARGWFGGRFIEITAAADRPTLTDGRQSREAFVEDAASRRARTGMAARLEATGLDAVTARQVAAAHRTTHTRGVSTRSLCATLAEQLAPLAATDDRYAPVEVFVGPPGVGKTTTIAKI